MTSKKQAILIMAHNNWNQLEKLIKYFDHKEIDIFLHVDKKAIGFNSQFFNTLCKSANFTVLKRRKIHWGTNDQILCELELFKKAKLTGPYQYYHLLSGNDVPLKPFNVFYNFFKDNQNNYLIADEEPQFEIRFQLYFNIFSKFSLFPKGLIQYLNKKSNAFQFKIGVNRLKKLKSTYPLLRQGHNWCDLKQEAIEEIISNEKEIKKFSRFSLCGDEMYKQIILCNSKKNFSLTYDNIRAIDWSNGGSHPKIFTSKDIEKLKNYIAQGKLIARKFDEKLDNFIIDWIYSELHN